MEENEMSTKKNTNGNIVMPGAPAVPGLAFRLFHGEADYPAMVAVIAGSKEADQIERTESVEEIAIQYRHLVNSDPEQDMLFVEVDGKVVGYGRVWWEQEENGPRRYGQNNFLLPAWRGNGLRRTMLDYCEGRLREIAAGHPLNGPRVFEAWAADTETHWESVLVEAGYQVVRYGLMMTRPNLEDIPDLPLPDGLEVRPVQPDQYRLVWDAASEAFRDHWGVSEEEWAEEHYQHWIEHPTFQPHLWQVAWDGDQVAGMVQNFIDEEENREYGRKRGWTEGICVRRPWRRRGLAKALIARSFGVLKEQGMTEAALGCDAENLSGAVHLYRSMGFQPFKRHTGYRKPML
jgi:mycothiol synthase